PETVEAAAAGGVPEVVIDVDVGLARCGCRPESAGLLADLARGRGLDVRGVMGYEGHLMLLPDATERERRTAECMSTLRKASSVVGGEVVSAGGTGTYALNRWASEIQAGSYLLMDTTYHAVDLPFGQALAVLGSVISTSARWAVADVGLKALGMDHGNPTIAGADVVFCSDEHITFTPRPGTTVRVGDRVRVLPAHIDPTMALHERIHLVEGEEVIDTWPVDLRGW
ncbi:MAG: alanine racemase, partial [Nocardioidaceae bacterium]